jgi:hypothetical protein
MFTHPSTDQARGTTRGGLVASFHQFEHTSKFQQQKTTACFFPTNTNTNISLHDLFSSFVQVYNWVTR